MISCHNIISRLEQQLIEDTHYVFVLMSVRQLKQTKSFCLLNNSTRVLLALLLRPYNCFVAVNFSFVIGVRNSS